MGEFAYENGSYIQILSAKSEDRKASWRPSTAARSSLLIRTSPKQKVCLGPRTSSLETDHTDYFPVPDYEPEVDAPEDDAENSDDSDAVDNAGTEHYVSVG